MRAPLRTLALALAASAALVPQALGQEDGVTLDPRDPAAKEYALPVDSARRDANGQGSDGVQHGTSDAEPFGAGVGAVERGATQTPPSRDATTGDGAASDGAVAPAASASANTGTPGPDAGAVTQASASGPSSTAVLVIGGVAALLVVGIGGFALRATRGPDQP